MYRYFISYFYNNTKYWGVGNKEIYVNEKISTWENIKDITKRIEEEEEISEVAIINYILLEESEEMQ